ncbi:hypothetical protein ACWD3I_44945 [Streptomyces sp. NPDC002817]|uniref:hypothetical protein n=1 Tax=Streptomyces sp. NPDC088357 TaxID=3154655 RepID=UPI00341FB7B0
MRKPLIAMGVALMATIGFAAPAQAAVTMPFSMAYGNSTIAGTIHFGDGYTASVNAMVHAASDARRGYAYGVNGFEESNRPYSWWAWAGGQDEPLAGSMTIPWEGGVRKVYITMEDGNNKPVARVVCTRSGCTRVI